MIEVGVAEAQNTLPMLLEQVERGEQVVILRAGSRVARLVPTVHLPAEPTEEQKAEARAAWERIDIRARAAPQSAFNWEEMKADLGRKY